MSTTTDLAGSKARTLLEALPYIRAWQGRTLVVKVGGQALDDPELAALVADDLALLALVGCRIVVVHGGGPQVSEAMVAAGIDPQFISGLRVTSPESVEIVRQVLIGSINNDLVTKLCATGLRAVGLSGADGGLVAAERTSGPDGEDLGNVGKVSSVTPDVLNSLLDQGYTPVVATVAPDASGTPMNINADAVAGAIAVSLGAEKLVYLTNVDGLYSDLGDEGSLISELKSGELREMAKGLSEGMKPKALSIVDALDAGVGKAHILDGRVHHALLLEIFTDEGIGTQVLP
jgi:acetylglutamate kinase